MESERTFVIHWEGAISPASPDGVFRSLPEIIRPRSISVDSFRLRDEINHWPGSISLTSASFDYPTGVKSLALLEAEVPDQRLGLTRVKRSHDEKWQRWLENRVLQATISDELVERDDTLDILIWGDTRLGLLPLTNEGEDWFLRQKLMDDGDYVPIFDVIVSLAGPKARLTDLLITVHSAVYSTEEQFVRLTGSDCRHSWISRFLNQTVDRFDGWFRKLIQAYPESAIRWHADGSPWIGAQLHQVFTKTLGPEEQNWTADVG